MRYAVRHQGAVLTLILSEEVQDFLSNPRMRNMTQKAEAWLKRLADQGRDGMVSLSRFRYEGDGIWALKPDPLRIYGWFDGAGERLFIGAIVIKKQGQKMQRGDFERARRLRDDFRRQHHEFDF